LALNVTNSGASSATVKIDVTVSGNKALPGYLNGGAACSPTEIPVPSTSAAFVCTVTVAAGATTPITISTGSMIGHAGGGTTGTVAGDWVHLGAVKDTASASSFTAYSSPNYLITA
jgi:hypothetical protein